MAITKDKMLEVLEGKTTSERQAHIKIWWDNASSKMIGAAKAAEKHVVSECEQTLRDIQELIRERKHEAPKPEPVVEGVAEKTEKDEDVEKDDAK